MYIGIVILIIIVLIYLNCDISPILSVAFIIILAALSYSPSISGGNPGNCESKLRECETTLGELTIILRNKEQENLTIIGELQTAIAQKTTQIEELKQKYTDEVEKLNNKINEYINKINDIRSKLDESKPDLLNEIKGYQKNTESYKDENKLLTIENSQIKRRIQNLSVQEIKDDFERDREIQTLTGKIKLLSEKAEILKRQILSLDTFKSAYEAMLAQAKSDDIEHNNEIKNLKEIIETLNTDVNANKTRITELKNKAHSLNNIDKAVEEIGQNITLISKNINITKNKLKECGAQLNSTVQIIRNKLNECTSSCDTEKIKSQMLETLYNKCLTIKNNRSQNLTPPPQYSAFILLHENEHYPPVNQLVGNSELHRLTEIINSTALFSKLIRINDNASYSKLSQDVDYQSVQKYGTTKDENAILVYKLIASGEYSKFDLRKNADFKVNGAHEIQISAFGTPNNCLWVPGVSTQWYLEMLNKTNDYIYRGLLARSSLCDRLFVKPYYSGSDSDYPPVTNINHYYFITYSTIPDRKHIIKTNITDDWDIISFNKISNKLEFNVVEIIRTYNVSLLLRQRYACFPFRIYPSENTGLILIDNTNDTLLYVDMYGNTEAQKYTENNTKNNTEKIANHIGYMIGRKLTTAQLDNHPTIKSDTDLKISRMRCGLITLILNTFDVDINKVMAYFRTPTTTEHRRMHASFENTSIYTYMHILRTYVASNSAWMNVLHEITNA